MSNLKKHITLVNTTFSSIKTCIKRHKLSERFSISNFGLYRDDGLMVIDRRPRRFMDKCAGTIKSTFENLGLKVTIEGPAAKVDFLDVTMDLLNDRYEPYQKSNSNPRYISNLSNHPPCIKRGLPGMIQKRISRLSKSKKEFDGIKAKYQATLKQSGYKKCDIAYEKEQGSSNRKRKRKKEVIYFNPPFCESVQTNIGKEFMKIVDRHFHKDSYFKKIFNRSTIKLSYSCMPNLKSIISTHNRKVLNRGQAPNTNDGAVGQNCNCADKTTCPLNNNCKVDKVIYRAKVESEGVAMFYIGSTIRTFKKRYGEHKHAINNEGAEGTRLSEHVWDLKNCNKKFNITWEILDRTRLAVPGRIGSL